METSLKNWILYCTINLENNNIYIGVHKTNNPNIFDGYIGCGVNIFNPSSYKNPSTPFQFAVKQYGGKKFKRTILKYNLTKEEAFKLESIFVDEDFVRRKDTYNVSLGGNGGKLSKEVFQFDFSGTLIKKWDSISEACEYFYCNYNSIYTALFTKYSRKGYYWSFSNTIDIREYVNACSTPVFRYDGESCKLIDSFNSIGEASRFLDIKKDIIQRSLKCGYKANGYYFSSVKEPLYTRVEAKRIGNSPIYLYSCDGDYITTLNNKNEVFNFFKIKSMASLRDAVRSNTIYRGYQISLIKEDKLEPKIDKRNIKKKVGRYSLQDELLEVYNTVTEARNAYGVGVSRCLRGSQNQTKGYKFNYIS